MPDPPERKGMSDERPTIKTLIEAIPLEPTPKLSEEEPEDGDALRRLRREKRQAWLRTMSEAERRDRPARQRWEAEHPRPVLHGSPWDNLGLKRRFKLLKERDALRLRKEQEERRSHRG
jgi:hypothetical protein